MVYLYDLTTILNTGGWGTVTKPVITELPLTFDKNLDYKFTNFKRAIRISRSSQDPKERSLGRGTESGESTETYLLEIKSHTITDCTNIINQIRDIMITDNTYTVYSDIRLGTVDEIPGYGMYYMKCPVICFRTGKTREVPS